MHSHPDSPTQPSRRISAAPILLAAMLAAGAGIVMLGARLSFLLDDWRFILDRREFSLDAFLEPTNEHLVAAHVAFWKLLLGVFGAGSTLPWRLVSTAFFLAGIWLLFVWARRRIGQWPALFATIPVLFLGAAFEDLLWFSSIAFLGSMAFGMAMLLALDRRNRGGDRLACAWLIGSMLFSGLWLAFFVGAVIDVVVRREERPWRPRVFLLAVPLGLYAAWWIGWGHEAESAISAHNLALTPLFVIDSIAAGIAAVLGLAIPIAGTVAPNGLDWGRPLAVFLIGLAVYRLCRLERVPRSTWVILGIAFAFWILAGLDVKSGRSPSASRYQYSGGAFVILIAVELLRGIRFERRLLGPALVVLAAAVLANSVFFHEAYESFRATSEIERADMAAVEIARDTVDPDFFLDAENSGTVYLNFAAGPYLSAVDAFGSPAYDEAELAAAPAAAQTAGDRILAAAERLSLDAEAGRPAGLGKCRTVVAGDGGAATIELGAGVTALRGPGPGGVAVSLRRFAPEPAIDLGSLSSRRWATLAIPADRSTRPWRATLAGAGPITICSAA